MKSSGIPFKGPMVRAIRDGLKTQTRRVVIPQPSAEIDNLGDGESIIDLLTGRVIGCPYDAPGDRLWVRETHQQCQNCGWCNYAADRSKNCAGCDATLGKWKPSIFMPHRASRITLEIVSVKVERVQDITEADAMAEGIHKFVGDTGLYGSDPTGTPGPMVGASAVEAFRHLWDSINSSRGFGWEANPWVWAITFKQIL